MAKPSGSDRTCKAPHKRGHGRAGAHTSPDNCTELQARATQRANLPQREFDGARAMERQRQSPRAQSWSDRKVVALAVAPEPSLGANTPAQYRHAHGNPTNQIRHARARGDVALATTVTVEGAHRRPAARGCHQVEVVLRMLPCRAAQTPTRETTAPRHTGGGTMRPRLGP